MAEGALVLVVGPSGAGKDTLISSARAALREDPRFVFPRRIVTRPAFAALEDHDTLDPEAFRRQKLRGAFALDWESHGLSYALPASIDAAMIAGRIVVANVSRNIIARALEKYPRCHVVLVAAPPEVRAARLSARGREAPEEVARRLAHEGASVPAGIMPTVIDNSGSLEDGVRRFVKALRDVAAR